MMMSFICSFRNKNDIRFHPSRYNDGKDIYISPHVEEPDISSQDASVRHVAFWKVSPRHMFELARESVSGFTKDMIRGCYVE
jgi:hypothetical protein